MKMAARQGGHCDPIRCLSKGFQPTSDYLRSAPSSSENTNVVNTKLRPKNGAEGAFMGNANGIATAIEAKVKSYTFGYSAWRVGLTRDWPKRKKDWGDAGELMGLWSCWQADSLTDAQAIERHFINKGMRGGTGGNLEANKAIFVYVF
jgi:hypothetical protein